MEFEFVVADAPPPSGFDLGHMTVRGSDGSVSSRGHRPDQSMMIHLSLSQLLDGLGDLLEHGRRSYSFGAVDSSFALHFGLTKDGTLVTRAGGPKGPVVDRSPAASAAADLASDAADFADRTLPSLPPDDASAQDLAASVADFTASFGADGKGPDGGRR
jgi:hypothetical protein